MMLQPNNPPFERHSLENTFKACHHTLCLSMHARACVCTRAYPYACVRKCVRLCTCVTLGWVVPQAFKNPYDGLGRGQVSLTVGGPWP